MSETYSPSRSKRLVAKVTHKLLFFGLVLIGFIAWIGFQGFLIGKDGFIANNPWYIWLPVNAFVSISPPVVFLVWLFPVYKKFLKKSKNEFLRLLYFEIEDNSSSEIPSKNLHDFLHAQVGDPKYDVKAFPTVISVRNQQLFDAMHYGIARIKRMKRDGMIALGPHEENHVIRPKLYIAVTTEHDVAESCIKEDAKDAEAIVLIRVKLDKSISLNRSNFTEYETTVNYNPKDKHLVMDKVESIVNYLHDCLLEIGNPDTSTSWVVEQINSYSKAGLIKIHRPGTWGDISYFEQIKLGLEADPSAENQLSTAKSILIIGNITAEDRRTLEEIIESYGNSCDVKHYGPPLDKNLGDVYLFTFGIDDISFYQGDWIDKIKNRPFKACWVSSTE